MARRPAVKWKIAEDRPRRPEVDQEGMWAEDAASHEIRSLTGILLGRIIGTIASPMRRILMEMHTH